MAFDIYMRYPWEFESRVSVKRYDPNFEYLKSIGLMVCLKNYVDCEGNNCRCRLCGEEISASTADRVFYLIGVHFINKHPKLTIELVTSFYLS